MTVTMTTVDMEIEMETTIRMMIKMKMEIMMKTQMNMNMNETMKMTTTTTMITRTTAMMTTTTTRTMIMKTMMTVGVSVHLANIDKNERTAEMMSRRPGLTARRPSQQHSAWQRRYGRCTISCGTAMPMPARCIIRLIRAASGLDPAVKLPWYCFREMLMTS